MSIANSIEQLEYPESDGLPMGETDTHRRWMIRIDELLSYRLREQRVYVGSNLLVYYVPGQPSRFVVPDNFVVFDCEPGDRRTFKIWEEGRVPDVVFEITSQSTSQEDLVKKPLIYEAMGVREYFLYDPTASYLKPALQGFRLAEGRLVLMETSADELSCETLGVNLRLSGNDLLLIDAVTGECLMTEAEANKVTAKDERIRAEEERLRAEEDRLLAEQERMRADKERDRADFERDRADAELSARLAAERRVQDLEDQLKRLGERNRPN
ncbi:MAG: Uma2 family endonuclease [Pirellula sp.]|nr:Uma2 family endonuclease [Pirellula sp.]